MGIKEEMARRIALMMRKDQKRQTIQKFYDEELRGRKSQTTQ